MTHPLHLTVTADGHVVIPETMLENLGWANGGRLIARVEEGTLVLEMVEAAIRRAQAIVRAYVPKGVSLADELIAERRAEALREGD